MSLSTLGGSASALCALLMTVPTIAVVAAEKEQAREICDATGVKGGLIVHLGCGDGKLTAALRPNDSYLVHGLDAETGNVARARAHIQSLGLYGKVSVERWTGSRLPYADNLVTLLVSADLGKVPMAEVLRVLAPSGVAYLKQGDAWRKTVKPRPGGVDEWTHFLHDASGNPVAHNQIVGPPRLLQWTEDPKYARSHEHTPSVAAVVSSAGRVFYIVDEAPASSLLCSPEWQVVARDAYNGVLLWRRTIAQWWPHICGWTAGPRQLQRRLVAVGDRVYVTLGLHADLCALDAATGETVRTYDQTRGTEEIVWHNGVLLLAVRTVTEERSSELKAWAQLSREKGSPLYVRETADPLLQRLRGIENKAEVAVVALEADTGRALWRKTGADAAGLRAVSLSAVGERVFCQRSGNVVCFDLKTGEERWSVPAPAPMRVASDRAVVCADGKTVAALAADTGKTLWSQAPLLCEIRDAFLINDTLWLGGFKPLAGSDIGKRGPVWGPYFVTQHDLTTGKVLKEINPENPNHHHRCYSNKATDRYLVGGRRGTEFIDLQSGEVWWNSWARGVCMYGVMPANGLLYAPPHACGCYATVKLSGFNALAPAEQQSAVSGQPSAPEPLEKGPAYGQVRHPTSDIRHPTSEMTRSGLPTATMPSAAASRRPPFPPRCASSGRQRSAAG
ncbi:MAG: hypothetical protein COZ06_06590 [Armatimonadetes bacterium CG_4_10_14_3_um_filter_66_18]|nr:PQQ-binding-like beta-propeller repeat protein [Armatimonadota bacterium]NDK15558.1 PQQ-binding-like beta-propeller repeat protein [Armatimonadota bacterium]PIY50970.1 MAG: hypothetical protein COZ06_06590 [Armatimonadetes bacterium CG_4_10_14_3_um_filter_66_18]PJB72247.1 MAG: hypothetical protein CO096_08230 [Armatimonadetes bacterium CG_4_9_14_3_um_filter_66_14]